MTAYTSFDDSASQVVQIVKIDDDTIGVLHACASPQF